MKTIPPTTAQTLRQTKAHTLRLTTAQALVRYLLAREVSPGVPYIAGMWAIFGHGNVAALGDALHEAREHLPTWRGHNE